MTDIRVNSVLPIARTEGAKSSSSDSDFLFSLQSVSAADIGTKTSTPKSTVKISDSSRQTTQTTPKSAASEARRPESTSSDSTVKVSVAQNSSQTAADVNSGTTQNISVEAQQTSPVRELQGTVVQKSEETGTELSELQNQAVKADSESWQTEASKRPMLDLNRILERIGSFAGDVSDEQEALGAVEAVGDEATGGETKSELSDSEMLETERNPVGFEETVSFKSGENAPVIDLDRILEGLKSEKTDEGILTEAAEKEESVFPIHVDREYEPKQEQTVLPQIDFDKILESVKGMQEGDEVIPSADRINAAEVKRPVKRDELAESKRIAANVGYVWSDLAALVAGASEGFTKEDLQASEIQITDIPRIDLVKKGAEPTLPINPIPIVPVKPVYSENSSNELEALYGRFAEAVAQTEKPTTLEQLKTKLANAMMIAIAEMNDPNKQEEELEEKILEFLLKFLEKMNEDDKAEEKALDGKKGGDLGILLQIIENMIDEIRDGTQIADSEENVFEIAPAAAMEGADSGYGVNITANANKSISTDIGSSRTAAERTDLDRVGAAEGLYAPVADGNANKTVGETQGVNTVEALSSLTIPAGQAGNLYKAVEDPEDMNAKAMKVLSRPNRDGTIREPELPDEFAELKKLINDMKRTHEDEEEEKDENDDDEEKEVGVGGKGVKGDVKSDIIRAVSVKASEPGEAAVAKSFEMDRSGAKQILSQIATEVLNNLPKEKRTVALVMTLTPENLGKVTLKITEQAGKLNVMVTAHSKETAEILASRMDGLQEALKDSGTQLEKYQVVYGPEHEADARQQNYEGSSKNPYVRQDDEEGTDEDGRFSELLKEAV